MHDEHRMAVRGSIADVLAVVARVERWPLLFRHYRRGRVMGRYGEGTIFQIAVWHGFIPIQWTSEQMVFPDEGRIVHRHLRGITTGLRTEWRLVQQDEQVHITVSHDWQHGWPVIGPPIASVIGALVVRPITERTLDQVRHQVESGQAAALRRLDAAYE